jgi:hypothetical protein
MEAPAFAAVAVDYFHQGAVDFKPDPAA